MTTYNKPGNYTPPKTTVGVNAASKTTGKVTPLVKKPAVKSLIAEYTEKVTAKETKSTPLAAAVTPITSKTELEMMIASQLTDRQHAPVILDKLTKNVTYFTASNGIFKVIRTPVALFKIRITEGDNTVPGLPSMEEGVDLLIPKIPFKIIAQALTFYRDVNKQDGSEVSSLYFWNHKNIIIPNIPGVLQEGQLVTYIPVQQNSSTLSEFSDDPWVDWFRTNCALLLELHSHNTMSAFFSGTDDANENMNQFYGVWGRVASEEPEFSFRWVCGDDKVEVPASILIDWPSVTFTEKKETNVTRSLEINDPSGLVNIADSFYEQTEEEEPVYTKRSELVKGPFLDVEYPVDWMAQHTKKVYVYKPGTYGAGYGPNYGKTKIYNNVELLDDDAFGDEPINGYGYGSTYDNYGYYNGYDDKLDTNPYWNESKTVAKANKRQVNRSSGRHKHKRK